MSQNIIGWTYDKRGNIVNVHAGVNSKLEPVLPHTKTMTGNIPDSVGLATNKWDYNHQLGLQTRPIQR